MRSPSTTYPKSIFKLVTDDRLTPPPLHPGEVLREDMLPHFGLTADDLAARIDVAPRIVHALLAERERVTPDLAIRLGAAFAQSPGYWRALQLQYDLWSEAAGNATSTAKSTSAPPVVGGRDRRPAA